MYWTRLLNLPKRNGQKYGRRLLVGGLVTCLVLFAVGCGSGGGNGNSDSPSVPTGLNGVSGNEMVDLDWDGIGTGDLDGYNVYRATSSISDVSGRDPTNASLLSDPAFTDDGLTNGRTYYYVVTAVDDAGNESDPSAEIARTPFSEPPTRPE